MHKDFFVVVSSVLRSAFRILVGTKEPSFVLDIYYCSKKTQLFEQSFSFVGITSIFFLGKL